MLEQFYAELQKNSSNLTVRGVLHDYLLDKGDNPKLLLLQEYMKRTGFYPACSEVGITIASPDFQPKGQYNIPDYGFYSCVSECAVKCFTSYIKLGEDLLKAEEFLSRIYSLFSIPETELLYDKSGYCFGWKSTGKEPFYLYLYKSAVRDGDKFIGAGVYTYSVYMDKIEFDHYKCFDSSEKVNKYIKAHLK